MIQAFQTAAVFKITVFVQLFGQHIVIHHDNRQLIGIEIHGVIRFINVGNTDLAARSANELFQHLGLGSAHITHLAITAVVIADGC